MKLLVLALVLAACAVPDDNGYRRVEGTPADVTTAAGEYMGYRVVLPCDDATNAAGVVGTGPVGVATDSRLAGPASDLMTRLEDVPSVWLVNGPGLVCESRVGIVIDVYDWRDVDEVIARTAGWLVEKGYDVHIGIRVVAKPGKSFG